MFWWRGSILVVLAHNSKDYEHRLKPHQNLFGEAQEEQLLEAAFPRSTLQLLAAGLLWVKTVYLLEVRIYVLEGKCTSREDYFGCSRGFSSTITCWALLVRSYKYTWNSHGWKWGTMLPQPISGPSWRQIQAWSSFDAFLWSPPYRSLSCL